jgi:hypothetical protein
MATTHAHPLLVIERILRDREGIWRQIIEERDLDRLSLHMLASSSLSLSLYGIVLGASNSWMQALSSAIKLPILFLATLAICLPTLYLFNLVFGARLSMSQAVALIMTCITVTAVLSLAFAPISLFFLISAQSYSFFKLLNVAILVLTASIGLKFLTAGMRALNEHQATLAMAPPVSPAPIPVSPAPAAPAPVSSPPTDGGAEPVRELATVPANGGTPDGSGAIVVSQPVPQAAPPAPAPLVHGPLYRPMPMPNLPPRVEQPRQASMSLLYIWIALFAFVGTQLAWTLRPFFGSPGEPFAIFRKLEGTFYADIIDTIGRLLGG